MRVVAKNGARSPTLFIDGKLKSVTHEDGAPRIQLKRTPENSAIPLIIGALVPGKPRFHSFSDNTIDEVAIFKTALTAEDVKKLMTDGLAKGFTQYPHQKNSRRVGGRDQRQEISRTL